MPKEIQNIIIIGSGNVAYHFISAFSGKNLRVMQVLARNEDTASRLSAKFGIPYITNPAQIKREADLYILAVQDDQIREAAKSLHLRDQLLVHTSGFTPIEVLQGTSGHTGVIWPLQTLTAGVETDYNRIPFFIESNTGEMSESLLHLMHKISKEVYPADSGTRQMIHLGAVVSSNLVNHLYVQAFEILEKSGIPFHVLHSLIRETAEKACIRNPQENQTGPAARNDLKVIEKHLELLRNNPEFQEIYRRISTNIIHHSKNP